MSYIYRCQQCRTRNSFNRPVVNLSQPRGQPKLRDKDLRRELRAIGGKQCKHCGHARFYVDSARLKRKPCRCGGYPHPHRPGSPCCWSNAMSAYHSAARAGASDEELEDILQRMKDDR